jgi:Mrp family chromosome partitioning ATPase
MIVRKAVRMAQQMGKTVVGVVENMSHLYVAEIDKKIELFGKSRAEEMAQATHAPLLGQLPIDPELAKLCDEGNIERYDSEVVSQLVQSLSQAMSNKDK